MKIDLEFRLRVDDVHVVGEYNMELVVLPPLGSLFYMHGVRFTVSDTITVVQVVEQPGRVSYLDHSVKVECSCSFDDDESFTAALCKLAHRKVRFDAETLELVEAAG